MSKFIFICHRHEEKAIADVISEHLQLWEIPKESIFQSSDSESGPLIGANLTRELVKALTKTNLLILVYTHGIHDWSYCTWECGLALDPETADTKIVVFECGGVAPDMFQENVRVKVNQDEIERFSIQFHKTANFFPNQPAFKTKLANKTILKRAKQFFSDLEEVIPSGRFKETPRLHQIKLSLGPDYANTVRKKDKAEDTFEILNDNLLIEEISPYCPQHFGYHRIDPETTWFKVVERWKNEAPKAKHSWINEMYREIWRAIHNKPAQPAGDELKSVSHPNRRYIPLLCLMLEYPDRKLEFNIYLYLRTVKKSPRDT